MPRTHYITAESSEPTILRRNHSTLMGNDYGLQKYCCDNNSPVKLETPTQCLMTVHNTF